MKSRITKRYQSAQCRIGSLEIGHLVQVSAELAQCRIGSLENDVG